MAQETNFQQIKRFINLTQLYIICEKSGGLQLAKPGLMVGSEAVIHTKLKLKKLTVDFDFPLCLAKVLHCFSNFNAFLVLFSGKHYYKVECKILSYDFISIPTIYCYHQN